ncbi:ornithine cyclodeaminase family protein [Chthonobacter albigriseus]|uniref:ornithine cyclodeaminase family protein n=1 Tax=Chthonobacter albigriseus TaxID=1683161 RepID=UPI0015EEABF5|nr:ornithine cyclodeaminase family protein [Chthonobacter albigriseus]
MRIFSAADIAAALTPAAMVEALREAFRAPIETPLRHHHTVDRPHGEAATLLLMPAWDAASEVAAGGGWMGVKIVTVFPGNAHRGRPTVDGIYLLMRGATGEPVAVLDGRALTLWRTAAASALAASYLARQDAARHLMVGAGALSRFLIEAHASIRPIAEIAVWNRDPAKAEAVVEGLPASIAGRPVRAVVARDLEAAVGEADIVSAATLASEPLVRGAWLKPGAHVDLVGGFTPDMREADDEAVRRSSVFVDTRAGAAHEAGDIVQPLQSGVLAATGIRADLFELCRGVHPGRGSETEITFFKSVGTALEDLAAASLVFRRS